MTIRHKAVALTAIALLGPIAMPTTPAISADYVSVERRAFDCVLQHSSEYLALPNNPLVIHLNSCPLKIPVRRAMPDVDDAPENASDNGKKKIDQVISLTKSQLDCLAKNAGVRNRLLDPANAKLYKLPVELNCAAR